MNIRNAAITAIAWLAIIVGALGCIISVITAAMFAVGSSGTRNASALDALITIAGPPLVVIAGVGLLRRKRIAWFAIVAMCAAVLVWQASEFLKPPAEFIGQRHSIPIIAAVLVSLVVLLPAKSRAQFAPHQTATPAPPRSVAAADESLASGRNWHVGHTGRDQMYYEELRGDGWQRITIDGEMLMGRAHHVIYFASPENWLRYPEWARHRRDEILSRIKSTFREPDYEYADGGTASVPAQPTPQPTPQPAKPSEMRAVFVSLALLLGITALMGWLVATGLQRDETYWPAKRPSQQRTVSRAQEPTMFWTSISVYSGIGIATLGLAACIFRWSRK